MGVLTEGGSVMRGVDFRRGRASIWIGIGRTSPWPNEAVPPTEDRTATEVEELVGYKLVGRAFQVVADDAGSIIHNGSRYTAISDLDALASVSTSGVMYLEFVLEADEFPTRSYRQVGVFVDLVPAEGFASFSALTPDQVFSPGTLTMIENMELQTRHPNTRHINGVLMPG